MKSDKTIWILEDDPGSRFVYSEILSVRYDLRFFANLLEFREVGVPLKADLLLADLRLPDGNFIHFLREAGASSNFGCDFVVVSSMDDLDVLRACYEDGASDFLSKPFTKNSLIVKVERLLSKSNRKGAPILHLKGVSLDPSTLTLTRHPFPPAVLTSKEFQIVCFLAHSGKQGVTRQLLQANIWKEIKVNPKTLDVHLVNLRKKLAALSIDLQCRSEVGYILADRMGKTIRS